MDKIGLILLHRDHWKKNNDLSVILCILYELLVANNPYSPISREAAILYHKSYSEFEQVCQEYVNKYAFKKYNEKLSYLFQEYYNDKKQFLNSGFIFLFINSDLEEKLILKDQLLNQKIDLNNLFKNDMKKVLIIGNKIFDCNINFQNLLSNQIIFVIPKIITG